MIETMDLKAEMKQRFDIDGFVNFGRILDDAELQELSALIDAICDGEIEMPENCVALRTGWTPESGIARRDAVWQVLNAHQHNEAVRRICEKPLIREAIELFIDGPAELWSDQFILKPAFHGSVVPWHQDTSYWGQEKRMTCWLAIDDATPFNGCLRMIPGSHLRGQQEYTPKSFEGVNGNLLETRDINPDTQVYVPVPAGCASFHHPLTLHASDPNTTPNRRRAIAITYKAL